MKQRNVSSDEEDLQKAVQDLGLVVLGNKHFPRFFEGFFSKICRLQRFGLSEGQTGLLFVLVILNSILKTFELCFYTRLMLDLSEFAYYDKLLVPFLTKVPSYFDPVRRTDIALHSVF